MTRRIGELLKEKSKDQDTLWKFVRALDRAADEQKELESLNGALVSKQQIELALDMIRDSCHFPLRPRLEKHTVQSEMLLKAKETFASKAEEPSVEAWSQKFLHMDAKSYVVVKALQGK